MLLIKEKYWLPWQILSRQIFLLAYMKADTCLLLHAADTVKNGNRKLCAYSKHSALFNQIDPHDLWLAFGICLNFRYIHLHEVARGMHVNDAWKQLFLRNQKSCKFEKLTINNVINKTSYTGKHNECGFQYLGKSLVVGPHC